MAQRTINELCRDVAVAFEHEYASPMNGEGVGYIVAEWLEGFVNTEVAEKDSLPKGVATVLLGLANFAREEGKAE